MIGQRLVPRDDGLVGQLARRGFGRADLVDVAPLRDEVVLHARDRQAVEELFRAPACLMLATCCGREARRELDDHAAGRAARDTACWRDRAGASRRAVRGLQHLRGGRRLVAIARADGERGAAASEAER